MLTAILLLHIRPLGIGLNPLNFYSQFPVICQYLTHTNLTFQVEALTSSSFQYPLMLLYKFCYQ